MDNDLIKCEATINKLFQLYGYGYQFEFAGMECIFFEETKNLLTYDMWSRTYLQLMESTISFFYHDVGEDCESLVLEDNGVSLTLEEINDDDLKNTLIKFYDSEDMFKVLEKELKEKITIKPKIYKI